AGDGAGFDLRRCRRKRGDRRAVAVRHAVHDSLCADAHQPGGRNLCVGRRLAAWIGVMPLIDLANPTRFLAFAARVMPWLIGATVLAFAAGLYLAAGAPDDY